MLGLTLFILLIAQLKIYMMSVEGQKEKHRNQKQ